MKAKRQTQTRANSLLRLSDLGQAVWLDFLSRRFIADGRLRALVNNDGLAGVTSNPSIFEKAIAGSADYDAFMLAGDLEARVSESIETWRNEAAASYGCTSALTWRPA